MTSGTGMAAYGILVSTISRVLNHAEGGVTKVYNRFGYAEDKSAALETLAGRMGEILSN